MCGVFVALYLMKLTFYNFRNSRSFYLEELRIKINLDEIRALFGVKQVHKLCTLQINHKLLTVLNILKGINNIKLAWNDLLGNVAII